MGRKVVVPELPKDLIKYLSILVGLTVLFVYSVFFLKIDLMRIITILGFVLIGAVSRLPQRLSPLSFGVELVSLVTIVSAILYSSLIGVIVGVLAVALSGFYTRERPQDVFIMLIGFALLGYFAPVAYSFFGDIGITALVLTVFYDLGTNVLYFFMGHNMMSCLRFSAMHIPSNYLILKYLGQMLI